jgi:itaconate CoA-transferase
MLGIQNEREWEAFCRIVLGRRELASDERFSSNSRRNENRDALRALIVEAFARVTGAEAVARLEEAQIANARVNDMREVWEHAQLKARERWVQVATPNGPIPALLPPGKTEAYAPRMDAVPALGQHTVSILRELGWTDETIDALRRDRAI